MEGFGGVSFYGRLGIKAVVRLAELVANEHLKGADAGVERAGYFASAVNDELSLAAPFVAVSQPHCAFYLGVLAASDARRFNHALIIKRKPWRVNERVVESPSAK